MISIGECLDDGMPEDKIYLMPEDLRLKLDALIARMPFVLADEVAALQQEFKDRAKECGVIIVGGEK